MVNFQLLKVTVNKIKSISIQSWIKTYVALYKNCVIYGVKTFTEPWFVLLSKFEINLNELYINNALY